MRNLRTTIGGAILTLAFIFGISSAAGITAEAQNRNDRSDRDDRNAQNQRRDRDNDNNQAQNRDWTRHICPLTMCLPCPRTPVYYLSGLYIVRCADSSR